VNDVAMDGTERLNWTIAGGALATSAALAPAPFTASLALGVALEAVNYRALRRSTELFFTGQLQGGRAWSAGFGLRFAFLALAMTVAIGAGAHPVGLVIGLSTIVPAVVIAAIRHEPMASVPAVPGPPPDDPSWDEWNPWTASERRPAEEDDEQ
jgi:hypothetical protein